MTTTPERTATLASLVAAEIRAWMGRLDVRQSELARRMGENDQWLSIRLKGRTAIDLNDLHRIAKALGLTVHQLLPPPEVAAQAADPQAMRGYLRMPDRPISTVRNRPPGQRGSTRPDQSRRTARLPRGGLPKAS